MAMQTKANNPVPRIAVRRSPRRLSVSLIVASSLGPDDSSIIRRAVWFLRRRPLKGTFKPDA
jgi:hypothetical protein